MKLWFNFSIGTPSQAASWLSLGSDIIEALREARVDQLPAHATPDRNLTEVIWRRASSMEEHESEWVPHRVVRRAPRSIVVEAHPWMPESSPKRRSDSRKLRTYWLDRWELKQRGFTRVRSRKIVFFSSPRASGEIVDGIESLLRLGLWFPCTEDDLRRAFLRQAQESHPDAGGNEERFLRLQNDRDSAATLLARVNAQVTPSSAGDPD